MKAVICTQYGGPEVLQIQEIAQPVPKGTQILIKIRATAVNSGDVRVRGLAVSGFMRLIMRLVLGISKPRNPILGTVFSGEVKRTGSKVTRFKKGDKVFGMTGFGFSTYAEYLALDQNKNVLEMPQNATFDEAAAIIFGGQTALYYLESADMSKRVNPKILILGATGSVGAAALQIAKYNHAHVTAVVSSAGFEWIKNLGADDIILYDKEKPYKHKEKFDIIFDAVGKYQKKDFTPLLNPGGIYKSVSSGYASENQKQLQTMKDMFEKGAFQATIDQTFPMENVIEAHRYVDSGRKKGNVVLKIGE
jgi:NADPH:quinone reductase-like Zn-dependent oxidoreductase